MAPLGRLRKGTRIASRKWGDPVVGTVTRVSGGSAFVQWAGSFVEDELSMDLDDIEVIPEKAFQEAKEKALEEAKRRYERGGWTWSDE